MKNSLFGKVCLGQQRWVSCVAITGCGSNVWVWALEDLKLLAMRFENHCASEPLNSMLLQAPGSHLQEAVVHLQPHDVLEQGWYQQVSELAQREDWEYGHCC